MISSSKKAGVRVQNAQGAIDFTLVKNELRKPENAGKFVYLTPNGRLKFTARDKAAKGRSHAHKDFLPPKLEAAARELSSGNPGVLSLARSLFQSQTRHNRDRQTYLLLQNGDELLNVAEQLAAEQNKRAGAEKAPTVPPREPRNVPPLVKRQAQTQLPVRRASAPVDTRFFHPGFLAAADFLNASLESANPEMWSEQLRKLVFERIPQWNPELQVRDASGIAAAVRWLMSETQFGDLVDLDVARKLAQLV